MCECECEESSLTTAGHVALPQPRQTVLTAAGSIGQASGDLLHHMGEGETDEKFQVGIRPLAVSMTLRSKQEDTHICSGLLFQSVNTQLRNPTRLYY